MLRRTKCKCKTLFQVGVIKICEGVGASLRNPEGSVETLSQCLRLVSMQNNKSDQFVQEGP